MTTVYILFGIAAVILAIALFRDRMNQLTLEVSQLKETVTHLNLSMGEMEYRLKQNDQSLDKDLTNLSEQYGAKMGDIEKTYLRVMEQNKLLRARMLKLQSQVDKKTSHIDINLKSHGPIEFTPVEKPVKKGQGTKSLIRE